MKKNENRQYPLEKSPLYSLCNKRKLEEMIGLDRYVLNNTSDFISYFTYPNKKKDGSKRTISAPNDYLKRVQRSFHVLLQRIERPVWLISGCKGKCYIDNVRLHQNNQSRYALTLDIKKFYPNCTREYVSKFFFYTMKMSADIANLLSDMLTYNSEIPTGSPTSQLLAFLSYRKMFEELYDLAIKHNCVFSVYVDDLAFSNQNPFSKNALTNEAALVLRRYGHSIKRQKTRYYGKDEYKFITGGILTPDNLIKIPNNLHQKIKNDREKLFSSDELPEPEKERLIRTLQGRLVAARSIEPAEYPELTRAVNCQRKFL